MVVQGSPIEITAQFTRLASNERFSSVEHCNVYKHERGQRHSQLVSVNHLGCKSYATIRYSCAEITAQFTSLASNEILESGTKVPECRTTKFSRVERKFSNVENE